MLAKQKVKSKQAQSEESFFLCYFNYTDFKLFLALDMLKQNLKLTTHIKNQLSHYEFTFNPCATCGFSIASYYNGVIIFLYRTRRNCLAIVFQSLSIKQKHSEFYAFVFHILTFAFC